MYQIVHWFASKQNSEATEPNDVEPPFITRDLVLQSAKMSLRTQQFKTNIILLYKPDVAQQQYNIVGNVPVAVPSQVRTIRVIVFKDS